MFFILGVITGLLLASLCVLTCSLSKAPQRVLQSLTEQKKPRKVKAEIIDSPPEGEEVFNTFFNGSK